MTVEYREVIQNNYIAISAYEERNPVGVAEISMMEDNIFFFNRLLIQRPYRGNGYSKILMDKLLEIVDIKKINIILTINPYGDMDKEDLVKFYEQYGFQESKNGAFVRLYKE